MSLAPGGRPRESRGRGRSDPSPVTASPGAGELPDRVDDVPRGDPRRVEQLGGLARAGHVAHGEVHEALDLARHRSEEHTSELQSPYDLVCRLLLEKKKESEMTTSEDPDS